MKPVSHPSNTRVLQAPAGWDQRGTPVEPLGVTDRELHGVPSVLSFWQPDAEEIAAIVAGGLIGLSIVGRNMPPALVLAFEPAHPPEPSPTAGMNLGERIAHVGGRTNAAGYIEFGSVMAVGALVSQVLRDRGPGTDKTPRAGSENPARSGALTRTQAEALIDGYGRAVSNRDRMHVMSLGKPMSGDVYVAFVALRDETIPKLRDQLLTAILSTHPAAPEAP